MQQTRSRFVGFPIICFAIALLLSSAFMVSFAHGDPEDQPSQQQAIDKPLQAQEAQLDAQSEEAELEVSKPEETAAEPEDSNQDMAEQEESAQDAASGEDPVEPQRAWELTSAGWLFLIGGDPVHGFIQDAGKTYYLDPKTGIMKIGWAKIDGEWYYFEHSGAMKTGWVWLGVWYYLNPEDGKMLTGKYHDGENWYVSNGSGAMLVGWAKLPEGWYYATGSGALKTDWLYWGDKWYYLDPANDGLMVENKTKTVRGTLYSFASGGAMHAKCMIRLDNGKCGYADPSGAVDAIGDFDGDNVVLKDSSGKTLTGWQKFGNTRFYADENGIPQTGWLNDEGTWYWLQDDGALATNAWVDGGKYYVGSDGTWRPYANESASTKLLAAAQSVGFQGNGYCAKWVDRVYMAAGYPHFDGDARDFYWQKCSISDLNLIEPGMVIGVPSHTKSSLGLIYGHVAIYMGNGMVRHNIDKVETTTLSSWLEYYQTTYSAKCGWAF